MAAPQTSDQTKFTRREILRSGGRAAFVFGLIGAGGSLAIRAKDKTDHMVWQIDPEKCISCGNCADYCVLKTSAVKCVRKFSDCGKCNFCFGYYETVPQAQPNVGAEYQACPTDAIGRKFLGGPYYEYTIDEERCIGCAICVKGCNRFGNGSMTLQIKHDLCLNCNQCTIDTACPSRAFVRVPASKPYMIKTKAV